jgi:hypothetical protein
MSLETCVKIIRLVKDARSIAADLLFFPNPRAVAPKALLVALLYRIQAAAVSLQADLIASSDRAEPIDGAVPLQSGPAGRDPSKAGEPLQKAGSRCQVIPLDRRRVRQDRRRMPTFLARDRRSGIADRRRRKRSQGAMR